MSFVPLTQAVTSGDASAVKALLASGADVNEQTGGGQTPLILATIFGHTHLIPLLLEAGADPQLRDNLGLNAVDWAQRRGATEAIEVLTNKPSRRAPNKIAPPPPTVPSREIKSVAHESERPREVSQAEKSQRWLAGLKQRIAEESQREVPDGPNIFRPQPEAPKPELPQPELPQPEPPKPEPPEPEPSVVSAAEPEPPLTQAAPIPEELPPARPKRKRCPKCNAIYNSDLVAYCAHHIVELVDDDEAPIISEPARNSPVLFWMIIIITLSGSVVVGSIVAAFFYNSNKAAPQTSASQPSSGAVQKGAPAVGPEFEGKAVSLPIAECPLNGQEAIPGTVIVHVVVDKTGKVTSTHASGGDWLLRGAATEAAMKSTFSAEKLRGRETEGTITYTFEP